MASLVPVADTATPGLIRGTDEARSRSVPSVEAAGPAVRTVRRTRSRSPHRGVLTAVADLASVVVVAAAVDLSATQVTPAAVAGLAGLWLTLLLASQGYAAVPLGGSQRRARSALRAGAALGLCCWAVPTFVDVSLSPQQLMAVTAALTSLGFAHRMAADAWSTRIDRSRPGTRVLVAGDGDAVVRAVAELRRVPGRPWDVVSACVTTDSDALDDLDVPLSVGVDDLATAAVVADAEAVLLLPCRQLDPLRVRRLGWQLEAHGTRLYVGTGLLDVVPARASVVSLGDLGVVQLRAVPAHGPARATKEVAERLGAALLLVVLSPLLALVALAVRRESAGPAIFRQTRIGRDGRDFTMYKFRTMTVDAESRIEDLVDCNESDGALLFKIRRDPRITRLGGLLRRYSVDELPQLVNVVLGDMALVGPRPGLPAEVARYDLDPLRRLAVRPGLTGLWQVSGRSNLSWEDTVRLDLHYVDNWSLALDVRIACRTVRAVLGHDGAY